MRFFSLSTLLLASLASARPSLNQRRSAIGFLRQNGEDAINLNNQFRLLTADSSCTSGYACVDGQLAQCVNGKYVLTPCTSGHVCAASPLVNSPGTSITCTTRRDLHARMVATGATNGTTVTPSSTKPSSPPAPTNSGGAQSSLTLLPSVIATNFSQNGLGNGSEPGEVASLTSTNNFINFCATLPHLPITNGRQLVNGSCNPAPMGAIPSVSHMPSSKFVTPANLAVISPHTTFRVALAVRNLATGYFVNPNTNYYAAPQQLDSTGHIKGHVHIVIEALESLHQTTPTDPTKFVFYAAVNAKAVNGKVYANVTGGLPDGTYRISSTTTAMNHQTVALPVAHRGASDDMVYFIVAGTNSTTPVPTTVPQPCPSATPTNTPGETCD